MLAPQVIYQEKTEVTKTRQNLELAMDHQALPLLHVFKVHSCDNVLEKLCQNHIHQVFVAGYWGVATPCVSMNEQFKAFMMAHFARWYSTEVKESQDQGLED